MKFYTLSDTQEAQAAYDKLFSSDMSQEAVAEFHAPLADYLTEKGLSDLVTSRVFLRLYETVVNKGLSLTPHDIVLTEKEKSTDFSLSVTVSDSSGGDEKEVSQTGQLIFSDDGKLDSVYFGDFGSLITKQ